MFLTRYIASNNNNANNMNTIAILPGGRGICPSPCKKDRDRREIRIEKDNGLKRLMQTNNYSTKKNTDANTMNDYLNNLCLVNANSTLHYFNKQNIFASAVIALNLFEDLLDVKTHLSTAKGISIKKLFAFYI